VSVRSLRHRLGDLPRQLHMLLPAPELIGIDVTTPSHLHATMHLFRMVCRPCRCDPSSCHGPCSTVAGVCTAAR
jgi:hypothetical protein